MTLDIPFAEVADKIPSVGLIWLVNLSAAAVAVGISQIFRRSFFAIMLLAIGWAVVWIAGMVLDDVWAVIIQELGWSYIAHGVIAPVTPLIAVLGIPSDLMQRFRTKRMQAGFCCTCGYDLTGNTSGVCPECGMAVSFKTDAAA